MEREQVKTYEMLWDCAFCGTKKLLGKTHRHCPECGAPQDPKTRYFPPDDEKVAVEDHVFVGADRKCPSCATPQSARAKHCAECGGPLEGSAEVARVADPRTAPKAPPRKGGGKKVLVGVLTGLGGVVLGLVLVAVLGNKEMAITVAGHAWTREIRIEDFGPRQRDAWCDSLPSGATDVRRSREVRSHKEIPDGETCSTSRVDNGDGTFSEKRTCKTKYRKEPVYDDKCRFTVMAWEYARSATAQGDSAAAEPHWPEAALRQLGATRGSEREGGRKETYTVRFAGPEGWTGACDFDMARWRSFAVGTAWKGGVNVLTKSLDCGSLAPPGAK